ncbi:MAG: NUDIX domain-containing protein [Nanoarchaeota archaeon]|nr:NUDIX domain-containing protein [Nanoarchaeota archaeon]
MKNLPYRKNVVGVIILKDKFLLVKKPDNNFWWFVQGGINDNESADEALTREIKEELNLIDFKIARKLKATFQYDWPEDYQKLKGFKGQEQTFFLIKLDSKPEITLDKKELEDYQFVMPKDLFDLMKYPRGFLEGLFNEIN